LEKSTNTSSFYWSFDYYPKSEEARRLSTNLFSSLKLGIGTTNRLSQKQKQSRITAFERCLSSLIARSKLNQEQQLYRSLDKRAFSGKEQGVSHNHFKLITTKMIGKGYLSHAPGKLYPEQDFANPDGSDAPMIWNGKASHYAPTPKLIKLVRKYGLKKKGLSQHFGKDKPSVTVEVRRPSLSNGRQKLRGRVVPQSELLKDPLYQAHKKEMELVNNFLTEQRLEGGEFVGLKRVFNNYTDEGYNWDAGGRMYDIDQNGYQKLPKEARSCMTINGEAVAEIDIEACFLSILCGLLKRQLPNQDMYAIEGIPRQVVKSWMTISLTNGKLATRWPPSALQALKEKLPASQIPTAGQVKDAVLGCYPWLERLSDEGIGWSQLQHIESKIMLQTEKDLIAKKIPAYPVHDSVIVPASKAKEAIGILSYWFLAKTGVQARISCGG